MQYDSESPASTPLRDVYSVSRLNREARALLEGSFPLLWVEGEISNFARPASGHWYFSLKDDIAQVRCAMFRNRNLHAGFVPENGTQVLIRARISMYEARGEFQIIAEHMEEAGDGALRRAFEALKNKLQAEGLFDAEHKRALPKTIRRIGVLTSPSGAAIRDILTTLRRRYPAAQVIVYPVTVQGADSAAQIAAMLGVAARRNEVDVLVLSRGGGSLEDLWSFNEEIVARAMYDCPIPIVTGIGHEIDITIADWVADVRAATPTAAAELITPDQDEIRTQLQRLGNRLHSLCSVQIKQKQQQLTWLSQRLQHPGQRLQQMNQRLDDYQQRLALSMRHLLRHALSAVSRIHGRLHALHPGISLTQNRQHLHHLVKQLHQHMSVGLRVQQDRFVRLRQTLDAVSPLATLDRGYAIVSDEQTGTIITDAGQTAPGRRVRARLSKGEIVCHVKDTNKT